MFKDQKWTVYCILLGMTLLACGGLADEDYINFSQSWICYVLGALGIAGGFFGIIMKERK